MCNLREKAQDRHECLSFHEAHQADLAAQSAKDQSPVKRQEGQGLRLHQVPQGR